MVHRTLTHFLFPISLWLLPYPVIQATINFWPFRALNKRWFTQTTSMFKTLPGREIHCPGIGRILRISSSTNHALTM